MADDPRFANLFANESAQNPAAGNLVAVQGIPPAQAADAHNAGAALGIAPQILLNDPKAAKVQAGVNQAQSDLAVAPQGVKDFIGASPVNAAVAQSSIPGLSAVHDILSSAFADFISPIKQAAQAWSDASPKFEGPQRSWLSDPFGYKEDAAALGVAFSPLSGIMNIAEAPAYRGLASKIGPDAAAKSINIFNKGLMGIAPAEGGVAGEAGLAAAAKPVEPAPHPTGGNWSTGPDGSVVHPSGEPVVFNDPKSAATWIVQAGKSMPPGVRLDLINGAEEGTYSIQAVTTGTSVPGINPLADAVHAAKADDLAEHITQVQEALTSSEIHGISPEKTEEFLEEHSPAQGQTAYVDPKILAQVYTEGHSPFADMLPAIQDAAAAGRSVEIPLSKYLTETAGQPFADVLNAGTRFSETGVSQNEGKEATKPKEEAQGVSIGIDNPGGDWLERKQQAAAEGYNPAKQGMAAKGLQGAVTGYIKQGSAILPIEELSKLTGVYNENPVPGTPKYDALMASVEASGGFDPDRHAIVVGVNHKGEAYLMEGNNRVAVAKRLGIKHIKAEVQWRNGGERVEGPFSPGNVKKMHADSGREETEIKSTVQPELPKEVGAIPAQDVSNIRDITGDLLKKEEAEEDLHKELARNQNAGLNYPEDLTGEELEKLGSIPALASRSVDQIFKEHFLSQLAESPAAFGMDKGQFARYSAGIEEARATQLQRLLDRTYTQIRRERTPEWKDQVARQSAEVEKEVAARKDIRARQELQYGEGPFGEPLERPGIKLDRNITEQIYGKSTVDALPKTMFRQKDSLHPDLAAEIFGYDSGAEMLHDLINLETDRIRGGYAFSKEHTKGIIKGEAEARARAELGYDVSPEGLLKAAREAFSEPEITSLLSAQMQDLAERAGIPPGRFTKELVEQDAHEAFSKLSAKDAAKPSTFVDGMQRTGKATQVALEKGDWEKAFKAKLQQLYNQLQYKMSKEFLRGYNSSRNLWSDLASSRQKPAIAQDWLDAIHGELQQYGYAVPQANLAYRRELWEEEQRRAGFSVISTDPIPIVDDVRKLNVEQFTDLRNRVTNMVHLGRKAQEVIRADRAEAMEAAVNEAVIGASRLRSKGISNEGVPPRRPFSELNAEFSQVQPLFDKMDDNNAQGVFNQVLRTPAVAAHARKIALRAEDHAHLDSLFDGFSNVEKADLLRNVPAGHGMLNPLNGEEMQFKIGDVVGMALHMGTDLNQWHLFDGGWGWSPEQVQALLDTHMTPKLIDFVAAVHNYMEKTMWPRVAAHEFESTGLAPSKEQPVSFQIGDRTLPGGYFPLQKDTERGRLVGRADPDISAMFRDKIIRPGTPTGFLKKRVSAQYPSSLAWQSTLFHHVSDVSNRVAYSEFVGSALRFLAQEDIRQLLATYGGPNAERMIVNSLQRQTGVSLVGPDTRGALSNIFRAVRSNYYLVNSTVKIAILLEHATALAQNAQVAGMPTTLAGYRRWTVNPFATRQFAMENSQFVPNRHNEVDVNMAQLAADMEGDSPGLLGFVDKQLAKAGVNSDLALPFRLTQKGALAVLNWINLNTVVVPHWTGAYYAALEGKAKLNGVLQPAMEHAEAVQFADKVVSLAHGSGAQMDLSKIQDGYNELFRLMNVNYGYHGNQFNLNKGGLFRLAQGRDAGERATGAFQVFYGLMAMVIAGLVTADGLDELFGKNATYQSMLGWIAQHLASGGAREIPLVRETEQMLENYIKTKRIDFQASPVLAMPATVLKGAIDATDAVTGKKTPSNAIRDIIHGGSYVLGVPGGGQIANTAQGVADIGKPGNVHPILGTAFGPYSEHDSTVSFVRPHTNSRGHRGR